MQNLDLVRNDHLPIHLSILDVGRGNQLKALAFLQPCTIEIIPFSEHLIHDGFTYSFAVSSADITGSGSMDLVATDTNVGLYLCENDGQGNFTWHPIHRFVGEWLEQHAIADLDGDGHLEVAASSWRIGRQFAGFERLDGSWVNYMIEDDIGTTLTIDAADFDGDGNPDLLATSATSNEIMWYQNPGDPVAHPWRKHIIDRSPGPNVGHLVDMDGDGDLDVVMALRGSDDPTAAGQSQIAWYERVGDSDSWTKHIISDHFAEAFEAVAGDIDGDGQMEVVATTWGVGGRLALFKHRGDPRGSWTNANQVILVDLTDNGRLDIAACAERGTNELRWWKNEGFYSMGCSFCPQYMAALAYPAIPMYQHNHRKSQETAMREMKGYIVPIFTPFNRDGSVDDAAMRHNISYLIDEGIHGITLTGSFGEYPLLSVQERIDLFAVAADEGAGRCAIIAGTSDASTEAVIEMSEAAARSGCDGLMIVPPPYLLPSERDLANHFRLIADRVSLPITIYNNPPRVGLTMSTGLLLELSQLDRVVSVKQSSQNFFDLLELIRLTADQPDFWVTNGQEHWAFPAMAMGAQAAYGVSPLLIGRDCIELYNCAQRDDVQSGRAIQLKVNIIRAALRKCDATPAACIRELANMRGLAGGHPRAPITTLSDADKQILQEASDAVGITPVAQPAMVN